MDLRKLKTILDLFENSKVQELELSEGEERLRLVKGQDGGANVTTVSTTVPGISVPPAVIPPAAEVSSDQPSEVPGEQDKAFELTAPMVGTYFSRPSPDEPPFLQEGDKVTEGQVACVIEAMKLFNEVTAPVSGTVKKIVVQNEQPVGFGDLLMTIIED